MSAPSATPCRQITIFDPINRKPYELTYGGGSDSEILETVGLETYFRNVEMGCKKRAFLCKRYQMKQCRARKRCNSIHADRAKIATLRAQYPGCGGLPDGEAFLDIYSEEDKDYLSVSVERIRKTRASEIGALILCCENSDCERKESCDRIHIESAYLKRLRTMHRMPCCNQHSEIKEGDRPLSELRPNALLLVIDVQQIAELPISSAAETKGLRELAENGEGDNIQIPLDRICRLHQRKACKWGPECNNIHICRKQHFDLTSPERELTKRNTSSGSLSTSTSTVYLDCEDDYESRRTSNCSYHSTQTAVDWNTTKVEPCDSVASYTPDDGPLAPLLLSFRMSSLPCGGVNAFHSTESQ
eukprot:TRINITY_DN9293_c0_g1_i1.p1 TRINITY_DN9293_c0_g1~~TRINITY_DN9293_c0_g1_i1.p1  ORF type:complete len:359 (+),score=50.68 TRINITY_DN9293_c0_g1_i1:47-1123(+)